MLLKRRRMMEEGKEMRKRKIHLKEKVGTGREGVRKFSTTDMERKKGKLMHANGNTNKRGTGTVLNTDVTLITSN